MTREQIEHAYMHFFGVWLEAKYGSALWAVAVWHLDYFYRRWEAA